jgi:hypothetical protein
MTSRLRRRSTKVSAREEGIPRINGVRGRHGGNGTGVIIDGDVCPLQGKPPKATTKGWGILLRSKL